MAAKRLREVRALESFCRLQPTEGNDPAKRAPLRNGPNTWLPAIEVLGEGVFLSLEPARLVEWERRPNVTERIDALDKNYRTRAEQWGIGADRSITPRLVLIHTLAHALINQWTLESGYPAAALRERLYVGDSMAGFLIYTATSDAAGSLGGVVAQATNGNLGTGLRNAIHRMSWCSSDPLCIEAEATGVDSLNLAACHACSLLPEVSCEEFNLLLDRALLVGTPDDPSLAFFRSILDEG
jgi:hypothetical protein